jgi:uncharacterized LabA/DUF88 family protein
MSESNRIQEELSTLARHVSDLQEAVKTLQQQILRRERVWISVDNSNLFGSVGKFCKETMYRYRIDYSKLLSLLVGPRLLVNARCYYSEWEGQQSINTEKQRAFFHSLQRTGFTLVRVAQRQSNTREKGLDAAIIRDLLATAREMHRCDTVILVSGDGDYTETIRELKNFGVRTEVVFFGTETSTQLREAAHSFTDLLNHLQEIELVDPPMPAPTGSPMTLSATEGAAE